MSAQDRASSVALKRCDPCDEALAAFYGLDRERIPETRHDGPQTQTKARDPSLYAPEPLRPELPASAPFPLEALGPILGAAARRAVEVLQCPAAMAGQAFLAAASLAVQGQADILVDGRREPVSLWLLTIGESGERKSAADALAVHAHLEWERDQSVEHARAMMRHRIDSLAYEKALGKAGRKAMSPQEIAQAIHALGPPPISPLKPFLLLSDPTLEGLYKLYAEGLPSTGLINSDAADFLLGHGMNDDNRAKAGAGLSKLWDQGTFSRVRATDGASRHYGVRFSLHAMLQPVIAREVLSDPIMSQQGFLARTLMAWPDSTIGTRFYRPIDLSHDRALLHYWQRVKDLLNLPLPLRPGSHNELSPPALTLSADAKRRWIELHDAIEAQQTDAYMPIRAWASKAASQALRIAAVLTLIENPRASSVEAPALDCAALLIDYYLDEALRITSAVLVPEAIRNAEAVLKWAQSQNKTILHSSELLQYGPVRDSKRIHGAMSLLASSGWVTPIKDGMTIDGVRRRFVWLLRTEER